MKEELWERECIDPCIFFGETCDYCHLSCPRLMITAETNYEIVGR